MFLSCKSERSRRETPLLVVFLGTIGSYWVLSEGVGGCQERTRRKGDPEVRVGEKGNGTGVQGGTSTPGD